MPESCRQQILMVFNNFWQDWDGIIMWAGFAGLTYPQQNNSPYYTEQWGAKDAFWTNGKAQYLFRQHMRTMVLR